MPPRRPPQPRTRDDFEIAIICALTLEADAVVALFDHHWDEDDGPSFGKSRGDPNAYSTGVIGRHNVVLAHLPGMGKVAAGNIAAFCRMSYPNINLALVVGICGGAPLYDKGQILLGDVIISTGVVQYDLGRRFPDKFEMKDTLSESLGRPNLEIRSLLSKLTTVRQIDRLQTACGNHLNILCQDAKRPVKYPGRARDVLFPADYRHKHQTPSVCTTCASCHSDTDPVCQESTKVGCDELGCDLKHRLPRHAEGIDKPCPTVHFGTFASGDTVMKSGTDRDHFTLKNKALGFEMESVGVWEVFPCVVIKSVCDYADSHKNKDWQDYAAASAAACTKAFLGYWDSTAQDLQAETEAKQLQERLLESLRFPEMNERRNTIASETPSTFQWIFDLSEDSGDSGGDDDFDDSDEYDDYDFSRKQSYRSYGGTSNVDSSEENNDMSEQINDEGSQNNPDKSDDDEPNEDAEEATDGSSNYDTSTSGGSSDHYSPQVYRRIRDWDDFENWLVSGQQIYWISGKPGSGKSTLMKFLLSNSRTFESLGRWREGTIVLSHFFWKPGGAMQRSFKGLLCSLVYQLLAGDTNFFRLLHDMIVTTHRASPSDWDQRELCNILYDYRERSSQSVCVFIDALDEAAPGQDLLDLLEFIRAFVSPLIKICVSSRPEYFFELHLREHPHLEMHALIRNDIVKHSMNAIRRSTILKPRNLDVARLARRVAKSADGVFLWAVLATRSLIRGINNGESKDMIKQRLDSMPEDLMDLYRDVLLRSAEDRPIYQKYVSMVLNLLFLLVPIKEPTENLTVFECMMAMDDELLDRYVVQSDHIPLQALQAKSETMRNLLGVGCDGFLNVASHELVMNGWMIFTHRAAQEFLLGTTEGRSLWNPCDVSKEGLCIRRFKALLARSRLELTTKQITGGQTLDDLLKLLYTWQEEAGLSLEFVASLLKLLQISYDRGFLPTERMQPLRVVLRCGKGQFLACAAEHRHFQFVLGNLDTLKESNAHETMYCIFYNSCTNFQCKVVGGVTMPSSSLEIIRYMLSNGYSPNWNIPVFKRGQSVSSPWLQFLLKALSRLFFNLRNERYGLQVMPLVLEIIQMFLKEGASMASKITLAFRCPIARILGFMFDLPEVVAAYSGDMSQSPHIHNDFFIEMNASAMIDIIVRRTHRTFNDAIQLNLTGPKAHMKALAFGYLGGDTLFVVESESASELLTEAARATFFGDTTTTHGAGESVMTTIKRCNDILEQLKPLCRPTKDPYFWKGVKLWGGPSKFKNSN